MNYAETGYHKRYSVVCIIDATSSVLREERWPSRARVAECAGILPGNMGQADPRPVLNVQGKTDMPTHDFPPRLTFPPGFCTVPIMQMRVHPDSGG